MGDGGGRARRALIVAELALALVLLVGGGLLLRTFVALQRVDLGFNPSQILTGFVLPPAAAYRTDAHRGSPSTTRCSPAPPALPGVTQAALASVRAAQRRQRHRLPDRRPPGCRRAAPTRCITWYRVVSANYFSTMEIPLRRGRLFQDREAEPVVVVNEIDG